MTIFIRWKQLATVLLMLMFAFLLASCASSGSSSTPSSDQSQATSSEVQQAAKQTTNATSVTTVKNGKTLVILPVTYKSGIRMHDSVRNECLLPKKLSGFIRDNALGDYQNIIVDGSQSTFSADVLSVEIDSLRASKGGGWSGPKYVSVQGSLKRNGSVIGNFQGKRTSMGAAFGVFKRTCDILGRCTKTLGKDIAVWLQNPSKNSMLGE
jgi:hypothetical protein